MQGRLLPKYKGQYQSHPPDTWRDEFPKAKELGLNHIEFILDYYRADQNPLLRNPSEILPLINFHGVKVSSVCADYFMESPFEECLDIFEKLLHTNSLGVQYIVVPMVEKMSLLNKDKSPFIKAAKSIFPLLEKHQVSLCLETDLPPLSFKSLLNHIRSPYVSVNYDIGNSASLGYDLNEEMKAYGEKIGVVHIKDRIRGGGPVELGRGDADLKKAFSILRKLNYSGLFTMQAYRDDEGVEIFKKQLRLVNELL